MIQFFKFSQIILGAKLFLDRTHSNSYHQNNIILPSLIGKEEENKKKEGKKQGPQVSQLSRRISLIFMQNETSKIRQCDILVFSSPDFIGEIPKENLILLGREKLREWK